MNEKAMQKTHANSDTPSRFLALAWCTRALSPSLERAPHAQPAPPVQHPVARRGQGYPDYDSPLGLKRTQQDRLQDQYRESVEWNRGRCIDLAKEPATVEPIHHESLLAKYFKDRSSGVTGSLQACARARPSFRPLKFSAARPTGARV